MRLCILSIISGIFLMGSLVSYAKKDGGSCYIIDCNNDPCVCSKSPCGTDTDGKRQYEHKIACNAALNAKPKKKYWLNNGVE